MYKKVTGTSDFIGSDSKIFEVVKQKIEQETTKYGYKKITLPTLEYSNVFKVPIGENTDVVNKELFELERRSNDLHVALRPEGTAQIIRAIKDKSLIIQLNKTLKVYYLGSMFRYERPQRGRKREFYQFGVESLGSNDLYSQIEVITLAQRILESLKITKKQYLLKVNFISNPETRKDYLKILQNFYRKNQDQISETSLKRLESNPLRILDSKNEKDKLLNKKAPKLINFLKNNASEEYTKWKNMEEVLNKIVGQNNFIVDDTMVRGLDYYNDLVFEFVANDVKSDIGTKDTIIGGGTYSWKNSNNQNAIGFAIGIERLILMLNKKDPMFLDNVNQIIFINPIHEVNSNKPKTEISIANEKKFVSDIYDLIDKIRYKDKLNVLYESVKSSSQIWKEYENWNNRKKTIFISIKSTKQFLDDFITQEYKAPPSFNLIVRDPNKKDEEVSEFTYNELIKSKDLFKKILEKE